ncbi:MAG: tRNA (adenosine(37)-N6)-dimethylallyltransferase MiaA [Ruminococcaceae bacterium]|nr:tRNA (adenosine(37)-N6)-dimethylallyltransferase MiaA [Oscillospiraceae bacterium]
MIFSLAITGPTASGKTAVSIELAKRLEAEIICCDSMQIYKGMDIGTAKATPEERAAVPHCLLDFLSPSEEFSAEEYRTLAMAAAEEISSRGKIPMFVGGTGLYIDTVMRSRVDGVPESSREYRDKIMTEIKTDADITSLWERLREIDPESADSIHKNNVRRVIRALEIYDTTGRPKSYFDNLSKRENSDIQVGMITLDFHNRENLYSRCDRRVDEMIAAGLRDEVKSLYERGLLPRSSTAAQAIGYKEMLSYIDGEISLAEAIEQIKLATRRYAKRQLTWFRHEKDAFHLFIDDEDGRMRDYDDVIAEAESCAARFIFQFRKRT